MVAVERREEHVGARLRVPHGRDLSGAAVLDDAFAILLVVMRNWSQG